MNSPEKESKEIGKQEISQEAKAELSIEKKEGLEKKELLLEKQEVTKEGLEKERAQARLTPKLKKEAKKKVKQIKNLDEKEKLEHLLTLADEKGVFFAIKIAKKMKDDYVLDVFHDILAKDSHYKKFLK